MSRFIGYIWQVILLLVWAMWWGGLSFYAIFVVPTGTEQIGSVSQGFITQQVTMWHNGLTGVFLLCLLLEAFKRGNRWLWSMTFGLAFIEVGLVYWHRHLTSEMDFVAQSVPSSFYRQHAVYLWLTAAEWLIGVGLAFWWCRLKMQTMLKQEDA
ncbi:MAG: hypothetical protein U0930_26535 [Pirellulales bacterium]